MKTEAHMCYLLQNLVVFLTNLAALTFEISEGSISVSVVAFSVGCWSKLSETAEEASFTCTAAGGQSVFVRTGGTSETVCKEPSCSGALVLTLPSDVRAVN